MKNITYFIDGKKLNLDKFLLVYQDGTWSSRGVNIYYHSDKDIIIRENWTNWQGEHNSVRLLDK
jgi:hypothetical protein